MGLSPDFPASPHAVLDPSVRWRPDGTLPGMLDLPPLVPGLREEVKKFRDSGYEGASATSKALLNWWFNEPHWLEGADGALREFRYYFAQREALETIVWLYEAAQVRDKFDLMRFDASGMVSAGMFDETWRRYVVKMATGSGKTKVMALALAWSYFHKLYEPGSQLARNFLVITPNIIVLDRIYKDFQGLNIFFHDPVLPDNGYEGRNWRQDFQLVVHRQDEARVTRPAGNIFLTNIHRVYAGNENLPDPEDDDSRDFFLGARPVAATTDSTVDLGVIVRDIDELMVINDEAHHIHDASLAWFKSIEDIHHRLVQKGSGLSLQLDVTATPRHNNGAIFVQTVSDYPLVEAIHQNVVKHPVLPDRESRDKLEEKKSTKFTERYADYLNLGVIEWRKAHAELAKDGKKAILFVMTDDTRNCDEVAAWLQASHPDLKDAVLVIHTKENGDISEAGTGKKKEELERLRDLANRIDEPGNKYKAIVSVLMLKEGWDVRNVTTIVGLRAYSAKSNILPEQTLGRGLRKIYPGDMEEQVSVIGTDAFMDFVETIQAEGVVLERKPMGGGTPPLTPLVIEVDRDNVEKNLEALDIRLPVLTQRLYREYGNLAELDPAASGKGKIHWEELAAANGREIIFRHMTTDEIAHTTTLEDAGSDDYRNVLGWFAQTLMKELRLVSGYDVIYGKLKDFVRDGLFDRPVDLNDPETLRNLSRPEATRALMESFRQAINALTVKDRGEAEIREYLSLLKTRPFVVKWQEFLTPKKCVFNRIIGDSHLELAFARFLEDCPDVTAHAKNYLAINFRLEYVNRDGNLAHYYPDFLVKLGENRVVIVETKGNADLDTPLKMERLRHWCEDANRAQTTVKYDFVYVPQEEFEKDRPKKFADVLASYKEYKG